MARCDPNQLASQATCFFCLPPGYFYPVKLALLARWLRSLNPNADTSVAGLIAGASCFACPPGGQVVPLKLALLCDIGGGTCDPNLLAADASCFFCLPGGFWPFLELRLICNAGMVNCDINSVITEASCYTCLPPGEWPILETALLCQISKQIGATNCDPNALMASAGCFACEPPGIWPALELQLLCNMGPAPPLPTSPFPYDNMATYPQILVQGLFGGVNGTSPPINWTSAYAGRTGWTDVQAYDNMDGYGNGMFVNALNGGIPINGSWNSAYSAR